MASLVPDGGLDLPALETVAGNRDPYRFLEFFTARTGNPIPSGPKAGLSGCRLRVEAGPFESLTIPLGSATWV